MSDELGIQDFNFQYQSAPPDAALAAGSSRGFALQLLRREGRGELIIQLSNQNVVQQPHHLLLTSNFAGSPEVAMRYFDSAATKVFETVGGQVQRVLAEVRIRAQCACVGDDARRYINERLLRVSPQWIESLGQPGTMSAVRFEVGAGRSDEDALSNPRQQLNIEVLREDPRSLYFELVTTWPQVPDVLTPEILAEPTSVRRIDAPPSTYVEAARDYLSERLTDLAARREP